jgi:hypothetical protein
MLMPKAAMDHYYFAARGKYKVRRPWQILSMQAKSVAQPMRNSTHHQLGSRVGFPNPRHACADDIGHI